MIQLLLVQHNFYNFVLFIVVSFCFVNRVSYFLSTKQVQVQWYGQEYLSIEVEFLYTFIRTLEKIGFDF